MFNNVYENFYKTLIHADRYKLFLDGLKVTVEISFVAILLGTFIGLLTALIRLTPENRFKPVQNKVMAVFKGLAFAYIDVIRGTPAVVQLLILYYVVFASAGVPKIAVAIIAFGINSGAYVSEIFRAGVLAVDKGQMESGRSLGLTYSQTMRLIIIPQAVKNILPALGNEFIVLIKETAIVGYIALIDLTKAADFIISRTFEAFFPLFVIAVIYFTLIKLLSTGLGIMERRLRQSDNH